ncbi:MAG: channel, inward rectifier [Gemmatimonadetes bacterium]|nr:channel, inward rectifier [Gemmatimonadota bacterium]
MREDEAALPEAALIDDAPATPTPPVDEPKDLGFGSVVGGANERRLIERDGSFTARRDGFPLFSYRNLYHAMLSMSVPRFLLSATGMYLGMNALFAWLFLLCGPDSLAGMSAESMGGRFLRAFFFSVETFATIGYGNIYPVGPMANWVMTIESIISIYAIALLTGLIFARFARPTAALLFSDVAVIAPYHGKAGFMFRITNARNNQLMELEAKVQFSYFDGKGRRFAQLKLERTKVIFFPLSWTIVHPIDETSPMFALEHDDLVRTDAEFLILISGIDETFAQAVHARSSYKPEEILVGKKFASMYNPVSPDGTNSIDVSRLSDVEDAPLGDEDNMRHTQTLRHTGLFTGFAAPRTNDRTKRR